MAYVTIHKSGEGGDALKVDSWHNGTAYAVHFGEAGSPMRTLWFQDDDATQLREAFDMWEEMRPHLDTRSVWLNMLADYL